MVLIVTVRCDMMFSCGYLSALHKTVRDLNTVTLGYTRENTCSACATCNRAKRDLPVTDFLTHVRRIAAYQQVSISTR